MASKEVGGHEKIGESGDLFTIGVAWSRTIDVAD